MKEIRLGTVGSGVIVHTILDAVKVTDGVSLAAVCSRNQATGDALAAAYGCPKVYTDLNAMLCDSDVNTVYIATPNLLHFRQAKQALDAGKHVILEKPFTTTKADAETLVRLAKQRKLLLAEAVPTPYLPNFKILKALLVQIGRVKRVDAAYNQYSARYEKLLRGELPNIFNPLLGGGCLMDLNFYNAYLNVALFGEPERAVYAPTVFPGAADTSGVLTLQYDGFVSVNAAAKDKDGASFFTITGERGSITAENGANGLVQIRLCVDGSETVYNAQPAPNRWLYEVEALTKLFLAENYDSVYANLSPTLRTADTLERARKSAGLLFPGD